MSEFQYDGPRDQEVKTYVEQDFKSDLDDIADELGMNRSQLVRLYCKRGLQEHHSKVTRLSA